MTIRMRAGLWAGVVTALGTTAFLLVGGAKGLLPSGMDLRGMALVIDPVSHAGLALAVGAANHIVAGSVIGLLYGWLAPRFTPISGVAGLMISWFALMLVGLPLTGQGFFGLREGVSLALWTFALHVIFGATMGALARFRLTRLDPGR